MLEGFPAFLLSSASCDLPALIIDDPELGQLDLTPVPGRPRLTLIISSNNECLKNTRETFRDLEDLNMHMVQVTPGHYPFSDASIGSVFNLVARKQDKDPEFKEKLIKVTQDAEVSRILSPEGCLIASNSDPVSKISAEKLGTNRLIDGRSYFIRPSSGEHYFVTKDDAPCSTSLDLFQHGRLESLRTIAKQLSEFIGKSSFNGTIRISISSRSPNLAVIERLARLMEKIEISTLSNLPSDHCFGLFVKVGWSALLLAGIRDGMIAKLPLCGDVLAKMESNADNLNVLHDIQNPALRSVLPKVVSRGAICGQAYWIEKKIEGTPATKLWWKPASSRRATTSSFQFIMNLHTSTAMPVRINHQLFDTLIRSDIELVEKRVNKDDPRFDLDVFYEALWTLFQERHIQLVRNHGDMWPGNLLVSDDEELVGVLDWDLSEKEGWPLVDLLHLLVFQQKWLAIWQFGKLITWKFLPYRLARRDKQMIEDYNASLSIEDDLWPGLVALYWLHRAAQVVGVFDNAWFRRNVVKPLPNIIETISTA